MLGTLTFLIFLTTSSFARATAEETCKLPRDNGSCGGMQFRWYFDHRIGGCRGFFYGGCGGNGNNFPSLPECNTWCGRFAKDSTTETAKEVCHLPRDDGSCGKMQFRWYFDKSIGGCRGFFYGGCEGNDNNFPSLPECNQWCGRLAAGN